MLKTIFKKTLFFFFLILYIPFVLAQMTYTGSTPVDWGTIQQGNFPVNINITQTNLNSFTYNFDGVTYPIYDSWLIAMYNFDNVATLGETTWFLKDISNYWNNGTWYNWITWTGDGKYGGAYDFEQDDLNYVDLGDIFDDIFVGDNKFSFSIRVKHETVMNSQPYISKLADSTCNQNLREFFFGVWYLSDGVTLVPRFLWYETSGTSVYRIVFGSTKLYPNIRYHMVLTYDGSINTNNGLDRANIYINGIKDPIGRTMSQGSLLNGIVDLSSHLSIGWTINSDGTLCNQSAIYDWLIDEVRIYDRVLSSWEILALYQSNLAKYDTDKRYFSTINTWLSDWLYNYNACSTDILNTSFCLLNRTISLWKKLVYLPNSSDVSTIQNAFLNEWYVVSWAVLSWDTNISLLRTDWLVPNNIELSNNKNKLLLKKNIQFKHNDLVYTGEIEPPTDYSISTVNGNNVIGAIKVGSSTESLTLTNDVATLSIPASGKTVGDPVSIYSSQDGTNWTFEKWGIVQNIGGQPYTVFTTNHFTYFAIASSTGSFVINDDAWSTTEANVTLSISAPGAVQMRFSNDGSSRNTWEAYATSKSRTLSAGAGTKTVYAQFDTNNDSIADVSTSDSITYTISQQLWSNQGELTFTITT